LQNGEPPERRFELAAAHSARGRYWKYRS
jgi:hypothetical protein